MSEIQASPDDNPKQESLYNHHGILSIQNQREELYLLAVGYYKSGDYLRSRDFVDKCLKIAPDWRQVLSLKAAIDDRIKGVVPDLQTVAVVVGVAAGYIAAAMSCKRLGI
ncbi:hypothetical protein TSUD_251920 [Trifolium subterraneum]|uniref:Mitochondrial fission 1 protein n=1 Tax=Trifolium subterraneum TaxID=3900 RepID=A0A2Z6LS94_TRISU|nr:hypothetical protein TSUD_251920 [Trifolium subterraneum]